MRMNQAIAAAIADEMRMDPSVIVFGEDVARAGGPFKTSDGLLAEFGGTRVRDTPISEMAFTGAGVGAAAMGLRPVVEIMFMEFLGVALDQLVTQAAKMHYLSQGSVTIPLTVRASVGPGTGFGCQHGQTLENWVMATPGLLVVSPSDPRTAYGLLRSAIRHNDPVMVLEPRALYGIRGSVDLLCDQTLPLGRAEVVRPGTSATVVGFGRTTSVALESARQLAERGHDVEVIDLLTLVPWDVATVAQSVRRTRHLVVVEDAPLSGGWGNEIVARLTAEVFADLAAAPLRICAPDVPVPFAKHLEQLFAPQSAEVTSQIEKYLATGEIPSHWWIREGAVPVPTTAD